MQDISSQHNRHRSKLAQARICAEKKTNQLCCIRHLLKNKLCAKLVVLRLMVTHYIGNMIAFLRCHYAYLSITITSKLSALNHNKIMYFCNCHATIFNSSFHTFAIFFVSYVNKLSHYKRSRTFNASLQVLYNAACVKM